MRFVTTMTAEMSFLLCHECLSWVEPCDGRCPECVSVVEMSAPDPSPFSLHSVMGEIVGRMGEIRIRRRMLPDRGTLYTTTNGLFFLPHSVENVELTVESRGVSPTSLWTLAAAVWWPLVFVLPFVKTRQLETRVSRIACPQFLTDGDGLRLPSLLMENPGVFFVSRQSVRTIARRWNGWVIHRKQGAPLRMRPESNGRVFHARMADLIASEPWQHVTLGR